MKLYVSRPSVRPHLAVWSKLSFGSCVLLVLKTDSKWFVSPTQLFAETWEDLQGHIIVSLQL